MKSKQVSETRLPDFSSIINTQTISKMRACWMIRYFGFFPVKCVVKAVLVKKICFVKTAGRSLNVTGYSRDILGLVYCHIDISNCTWFSTRYKQASHPTNWCGKIFPVFLGVLLSSTVTHICCNMITFLNIDLFHLYCVRCM